MFPRSLPYQKKSLVLVLQNKANELYQWHGKYKQKSAKRTPFGGIFFLKIFY